MTRFQNSAPQIPTEPSEATPSVTRVRICGDKEDIFLSFEGDEPVYGFARVMKALGSADPEFVKGLLNQIVVANQNGNGVNGCDQAALDFTLANIMGIKPADQLEAMLATQMSGIHSALMKFLRRVNDANALEERESVERALNRLARTFAMQMDTLKRWRTGGEQKVTVQHVSVSQGGQAIVANVTKSAREDIEGRVANSPTALTDARATPMKIIEDNARRAPVVAKKKTRK